ncbi:serine threonine-protein phosphatase [Seminavis robusta]|uniref:Serine threonine-protein phosphatase n=1 Tax=Seminavis robusta TaxID=568900 RepID=A0A9N8H1Y0_9STRA|nr:serine threonine-protein phosphatase [Seminavis robusta]|eukprot:Sro25_g017140.1 serine threonine-protein phosphatase (478) ;mRNA; f:122641-124258
MIQRACRRPRAAGKLVQTNRMPRSCLDMKKQSCMSQVARRSFCSICNQYHYHQNYYTHRPRRTFSTSDDDTDNTMPPSCLLPYVGLPSYPDVIELEPGQRVVAIGDVHGDFGMLLTALQLAGVIAEEIVFDDDNGEEGRSFVWTGGSDVLVQIGDVLDRGPHELQCWQLLMELSRQAQGEGGKVILLHGNHEIWTSIGFYQLDQERYMENIDYDDDIDDAFEMAFGHHLDETLLETEDRWRDARVLNALVTNGISLHPRKVAARWAACEPGGLLAKDFLSQFKIAVTVGNSIFVHAGIAPEHLDRFGGISGMNETTRNWILKKGPRVGRQHMFVPPNDPEGRLRTYVQSMPDFFMEGDDNAFSPIWMRDYGDPADDIPHNHNAYDMLETVLRRLKADRLVIGHTPQSQINAILNGKAWRIDVGMSRGMNSTYPEVLEIVRCANGDETVSILTAEGPVAAEERYIIDDDHVENNDEKI